MPNYQESKIYKLESIGGLYIGSTTYTLSHRLSVHKAIYKRYMNGAITSCPSSSRILEHPDCKISLIELFPCTTKQELRNREQFYIMTFPECVNIQMRSTKEEIRTRYNQERMSKYYQAREATREEREAKKVAKKEALLVKRKLKEKEFYQENKERLIEKSRAYYEQNKERCIDRTKEWQAGHKEHVVDYMKGYYQQNKQRQSEYTKSYYAQNKETINARISCPICNKSMAKNSLRNHMPRFHLVLSDVPNIGDTGDTGNISTLSLGSIANTANTAGE